MLRTYLWLNLRHHCLITRKLYGHQSTSEKSTSILRQHMLQLQFKVVLNASIGYLIEVKQELLGKNNVKIWHL